MTVGSESHGGISRIGWLWLSASSHSGNYKPSMNNYTDTFREVTPTTRGLCAAAPLALRGHSSRLWSLLSCASPPPLHGHFRDFRVLSGLLRVSLGFSSPLVAFLDTATQPAGGKFRTEPQKACVRVRAQSAAGGLLESKKTTT